MALRPLPSLRHLKRTVAVGENPVAVFGEGFAAKLADEGLRFAQAVFSNQFFEMNFRAIKKDAHSVVLALVFGQRVFST